MKTRIDWYKDDEWLCVDLIPNIRILKSGKYCYDIQFAFLNYQLDIEIDF